MGILSFLSKSANGHLAPLPSGSFTMDRQGRIMTSTLPQSYPEKSLHEIGTIVLRVFRLAKDANMPMTELLIHFSALKVMARELRGGAMIFLTPQSLSNNYSNNNT